MFYNHIFLIEENLGGNARKRVGQSTYSEPSMVANQLEAADDDDDSTGKSSHRQKSAQFRRIMLLIIAVTVHNIPGKKDLKCALWWDTYFLRLTS